MKKGQLKSAYEKSASTIEYARDRRTSAIVRLPGSVENDDWYDEGLHKGHLQCGGCDAPVHISGKAESIKGSRDTGANTHFKTNPGAQHANDCEFGQPPTLGPRPKKTGGFKLNHNTSTSDYYEPSEETIVPLGLEPISIKSMEDVARLMRTQEIDRLRKSFAIFREHESAWENYMFSDNDAGCKKHLIDTVDEMVRKGRSVQLACMELHVDKDKIKEYFRISEKSAIPGKTIKWYTGRDGVEHVILPRYTVDKRLTGHDTDLTKIFDQSRAYMAQGLITFSTNRRGNTVFYFPEMPIVTEAQVMKTSLSQLLAENRAHFIKKSEMALKVG